MKKLVFLYQLLFKFAAFIFNYEILNNKNQTNYDI